MLTPVGRTQATPKNSVYSNQLVFWLNGRKVVIPNPDPTVLLTDYLHSVGLYGTNIGLTPRSMGGWGLVYLVALCALSSGAIYALFKRRDWI